MEIVEMKMYVIILIAIIVIIIIAVAVFVGYNLRNKKIKKNRSRVGRLEKDRLDRDSEILQLYREKKELNDTLQKLMEKHSADPKV